MDLRGDRKRTLSETKLALKKFAMTRASSPAREGACAPQTAATIPRRCVRFICYTALATPALPRPFASTIVKPTITSGRHLTLTSRRQTRTNQEYEIIQTYLHRHHLLARVRAFRIWRRYLQGRSSPFLRRVRHKT